MTPQERVEVQSIADELADKLDEEDVDRQYIAENALARLDTLLGQQPRAARVWH